MSETTPTTPIDTKPTTKNTAVGCLIILAVMGLGFWVCGVDKKEDSTPKSFKELRKNLVEKQFSVWDGSHIDLTRRIKEAMNDPESFKHEKTTFRDLDSVIFVTETFRGKNAYGGVVKNTVQAIYNAEGTFIKMIDND